MEIKGIFEVQGEEYSLLLKMLLGLGQKCISLKRRKKVNAWNRSWSKFQPVR